MAQSPAQDSDAILAAAQRSLADQRAGGRRVPRGKPIGQRSARMRRRQAAAVLATMAAALLILVLAVDLVVGQFHASGLAATIAAVLAAVAVGKALRRHATPAVPALNQLPRTPIGKLVGNTQLWLEAQRPQLPPPARDLVGQLGGKLDLLATQLDRLSPEAPAVAQVRALVGEHLPQVVGAYTEIPPPLRAQPQAGTSPDAQLAASLTHIGTEIDSVTHQLAEGAIDRLAIQARYLDMKYGAASDMGGGAEG